MKTNLSQDELSEEYQFFESISEVEPPVHLSAKILKHVHSDFNPSPLFIFSKLSLIHAVVGTSTVFFCPQFGFKPLSDLGLMNLFMKFGEIGCMIGCGALYIGSTALAASLFLKRSEIKVLRRTKALQIPLLSLLSIGALMCLGASVVFKMTVIFWLMGSIFGGIATFELGWFLRKMFQKNIFVTK